MYENYAKIRDSKGLRDSDVSRATGIAPSIFSDWKAGRYDLKYDKLKKIADFLGVSVESFDNGEYYVNQEAAEYAQELFSRPGMKVLFDAARDSKQEDLQMAADLLNRLKGTNNDG